ncbi:ATP-dependent DNA helicase RecQ [Richelia intracellularis]|nr:ATP-dependent DNA helicase RecQ [Richelia intracellularis]
MRWGDTFRPAYRRLGAVRAALLKCKPPGTKIVIAAFTATADPRAQQIIQSTLQLEQPKVFPLNPYPQNICPQVRIIWTPRGRKQKLCQFIQHRPEKPELVYVRTRRNRENLANMVSGMDYSTAAYHGGLGGEARGQIESDWLKEKNLLLFVILLLVWV